MNVKRYRDDKGNVWGLVRADNDEVEFRSPTGGPGLVMLAEHFDWLIDQGLWAELQQYADDVAWYRRVMELARQNPQATFAHGCTCDIHLLMRSGCQCGGFAAEQASKQQ